MKNKFKIIILIQFISTIALAQQNNYQFTNGDLVIEKIYGERVLLFEDPTMERGSLVPNVTARGGVPIIGGIIADYGLRFIQSKVKKNEAAYTSEYGARTTLNSSSMLTNLILVRRIVDSKQKLTDAANFLFEVKSIDNIGFNYVLNTDKVELNYSKAKIKNDHYFLDLAFEIEVTYLTDDNKKSSIKSKPFYYSVFSMKEEKGSNIQVVDSYNLPPMSDVFPHGRITEVSIKVTESNPYKVRLEKVQEILEKNKDLISELLAKLKEN